MSDTFNFKEALIARITEVKKERKEALEKAKEALNQFTKVEKDEE